jgi:hypothetical protein
MRGSHSNQSSENEHARRKQNRHLSAAIAGTAKAVTSGIDCPRVPCTRWKSVRLPAVAMALVLLAGGGAGHQSRAFGADVEAQIIVNQEVASPAPVAGWADGLYELLYDLLYILADAWDGVGGWGCEGPLGDPAASLVQADLADAESIIVQILDPNQAPCLDPVDAGSVDSGVEPALLSEYAYECKLMAEEALQAALSSPTVTNAEIVGTKLKTIASLLPGYRQEAGIE